MPINKILLAGRYTDPEGEDGICRLKLADNRLIITDAVSAGINPSYIIIADGLLYAANEIESECRISISTLSKEGLKAFEIDNDSKVFMHAPGSGVCHLSYDKKTGLLFASCYGSGHIHCFNTHTRSLSCSFLPKDSHNSHAHNTAISDDGKWLFATDLGKDEIHVFTMEDIIDKRMEPVYTYKLSPGTGPRQIITGLSDNRIICINELSSSVMIFSVDERNGRLYPEHMEASTRKMTSDNKNYPGTAALSKGGKYLIVPNRGADTLALFEIGKNEIIWRYECDCYGNWPRYVAFTEDYEFLLVANQKSGNVALFAYREESETPLKLLDSIAIKDVSCIIAL